MKLPQLFGATLFPLSLAAAEPSPDKAQFTLFNPTPRALMREMSTDRPDQTESAYTIDAGHFQVESDLLTYTRDSEGGSSSKSFAAGVMNLKVGLLNNVDLQLIVSPYVHEKTYDSELNSSESVSGFGDLVPRVKISLWGNDSGPFAISMMPFLKLPTGNDELSNGSVEGGMIFPMAIALPADWGMGLMTEFDFLKNGADSGYHTEFVNTITVSHDIVGALSGYVEFVGVVSTESRTEWQGFVDGGFTYAFTENIRLDAGINIGVTRSAPDWNPFLGLSFRY